MCVTSQVAEVQQIRAFTYATIPDGPRSVHVSGFQCVARNQSFHPNCMLLHFPGDDIKLVGGPERTEHLMDSLTDTLPSLEPITSPRPNAPFVEGDEYIVVLAEEIGNIIPALQSHEVPFRLRARPESMFSKVHSLAEWYGERFAGYSFALVCWTANFAPSHPVVVSYVPHNDDVLFVPGVKANGFHSPLLGSYMRRDMKVAFGVQGVQLPHEVTYIDDVDEAWAPNSVSGFHDNRPDGANDDYIVALENLQEGFTGDELARELIN